MASIEREVENALLNVVSGVTGVNFFTSERGTARTMPSVTVQAQIGAEELIPFSGVFKTPASITYVARADTTARTAFDAKFYDILEQLYRSPDLASYLTTNSNITFYVAKVTGDTPAVISQNRTWSRAMTLDITATAKKFLPPDIGYLSAWFKADDGVNVSGTNVTSWLDKSGNENNATAYNNPQLITSALNGKPVIFFNGASKYALFQLSIQQNTARTIFIVGKYNNLNGGQQGFLSLGSDDGYVFLEGRGADQSFFYNNSGQVLAPSTYSVGNYHIVTVNSGGNTSMAINGLIGSPAGLALPEVNAGTIANRSGFNEYANCNIAEIIIYNKQLNATETDQVQKYLNYKYAIY